MNPTITILVLHMLNGSDVEKMSFDEWDKCVKAAKLMNERALPALKEIYRLSTKPEWADKAIRYDCIAQFGGPRS